MTAYVVLLRPRCPQGGEWSVELDEWGSPLVYESIDEAREAWRPAPAGKRPKGVEARAHAVLGTLNGVLEDMKRRRLLGGGNISRRGHIL